MRTRHSLPWAPVRAGAIVTLLVLAAAFPVQAQADPGRRVTIEDFFAEIVVAADGRTHVTETLRVRFDGEWNGLERIISRQHQTARGRRALLDLDIEPVTDDQGNVLRVEQPFAPSLHRLRIYPRTAAKDATHTFVIRYVVANAIRFFAEGHPTGFHDELYWNVTGNEWSARIEQARALVTLPDGVAPSDVSFYTGPTGARGQDAVLDRANERIVVATTRALDPGDGLTISVSWAPGVIARPTTSAALREDVGYYWPIGLPFLAFTWLFGIWRRHGRDPEAQTITVQYEPPADLSPAELGTLVDHRAQIHDINATLVDLAVRGYLRIEEREEKKLLGLLSRTEYWFHQRQPRETWNDLRTHERRYLNALFARPDPVSVDPDLASVKLSSLTNKFHESLSGIRNGIYDRLVRLKFYRRRPDKVRAAWLIGAGVLGGAGAMGASFLTESFLVAGPAPLIGGILASAALMAFFGWFMPAWTTEGARAREHALGFREFLDRVERDRFDRTITTPDLFERFLPFAMAFRCEDRWAKKFEDLLVTPPDWYSGGSGNFSSVNFTRGLSGMSSQAASTMSSSPSGSGGGGGSGGGSGGGGGGGF
jgi:uncharacterized membrane protein YgcG